MVKYLIDTTVCVAHIRGDDQAFIFIQKYNPYISAVTHAELLQGCQNKRDLKAVHVIVENLPGLLFTEKITTIALSIFEKYHLSHGVQFLDTLIAATAIEHNLTLVTHNQKHFSFIPDLLLQPWDKVSMS